MNISINPFSTHQKAIKLFFDRFFIFAVFILFCIPLSYSQSSDASFKRATQATTLLRNDHDRIPLQRLDTLRIGYIQFGIMNDTRFLDRLQSYTDIHIEKIPEKGHEQWIEEVQQKYNLLILEIQDYPIGQRVPPVFAQEDLLKPLAPLKNTITVIVGEGSIFQPMLWMQQVPQLLIAPHHMDEAPDIAAQIIFGGLPAIGKLLGPIPGTHFKRGEGFSTEASRLGYAPPAYVDMDKKILDEYIEAIIGEGIEAAAFPGAQVLVARKGKVVYHEAFGHLTKKQEQVVKKDAIYDLASITKISGPLPALMKLHGEGKFELDAPLKKYIKGFSFSNKAKLTFRPMLAHNAGLRPWIPYWRNTLSWNEKYPWKEGWDNEKINDFDFRQKTFQQDSSEQYTIKVTDQLWLHHKYKKQMYRAIKKSPLNEQKEYAYSGLLFYLLPDIIENISGQNYVQYLHTQFYDKLGAELTYKPLEKYPLERIIPTERDTFFRMQLLHGTVHDEGAAMMDGISGNAGLFGTAEGLAKLMSLYLNEGTYGGEQLIAAKSIQEFTHCHYCEEGNRRGLGFDKPLIEYDAEKSAVAEEASPASYGHSGYTGTFTWVDPKQELIFIFLSNRVYPTRANRRIYELNIRPRIHEAIYKALK